MRKSASRLLKGLLFISLLTCFSDTFAQTIYKGSFCTGLNQFAPITYTREYKQEGADVFITLYKISSRIDGYYLNITATHYKSEKKVVVSVDDVSVKIGGHISTQTLPYDELSLDMFGRQGSFKAMYDAQNVLPNEIAVKFVSGKFENVKVVHIAKDTGMNAMKWYVLDE